MNFFFALNVNNFKCSLTIPKFTNEGKTLKNISLFSSKIKNNLWLIKKRYCDEDKNFFYLNVFPEEIDDIFFLSHKNYFQGVSKVRVKELSFFNKIDTGLTYRANLNISNSEQDSTSYQSEYPIEMTHKTGSILTPINSFTNNGQNNLIIFKQINYLPVKQSFSVYLVDLLSNEILLKKKFYTNSTNIIDLTNINKIQNCCFYSEGFLGIPIFISYGNKKGLSMEHSHPGHLYLLSKNKFHVISNLKEKVKEIVFKSY